VERYGKIANHDRPQLRMINQDDLAAKLRYNQDDLALVLKQFQGLRAESVAILGALAAQSWQRVGVHPKRGDVSIAWTAEHHVEHDANHLGQIRALVEQALAGAAAPQEPLPGEPDREHPELSEPQPGKRLRGQQEPGQPEPGSSSGVGICIFDY
jgi:hypothetical protein